MKKIKKVFYLIIFFIFVIFFYSCSTTIYDLKTFPDRYNGEKVVIAGNVKEVFDISYEKENIYGKNLYIYSLEDEGLFIYVITPDKLYLNSYRKTSGKVFYLKSKTSDSDINLFYRYLYGYMAEKGFFKKDSTEKVTDYFLWHIFKFLINVFTDSRFDNELDDFDDAVKYAIENTPSKKEKLEETFNKVLYMLPENSKIIIILEEEAETY